MESLAIWIITFINCSNKHETLITIICANKQQTGQANPSTHAQSQGVRDRQPQRYAADYMRKDPTERWLGQLSTQPSRDTEEATVVREARDNHRALSQRPVPNITRCPEVQD